MMTMDGHGWPWNNIFEPSTLIENYNRVILYKFSNTSCVFLKTPNVKDANANLPKAPEPYTRGSGGGAFRSAKDDHQSRVLWKLSGNDMNQPPEGFKKTLQIT